MTCPRPQARALSPSLATISRPSITTPAKKTRSVAAPRPRRFRREKIVKESALGALLKPIGISIALVLSAYALLSLGTTF